MSDKRIVARLVYWANEGAAWYDLARRAGYELDGPTDRRRLVRDGRVVAYMDRIDGEWFGFVWVPEARCPRWREAIWRLTHPLTPRTARSIIRA